METKVLNEGAAHSSTQSRWEELVPFLTVCPTHEQNKNSLKGEGRCDEPKTWGSRNRPETRWGEDRVRKSKKKRDFINMT